LIDDELMEDRVGFGDGWIRREEEEREEVLCGCC